MGRSAAGVRGMRLRAGDEVVSCDVARDGVDLLIVTDAGYGKRTKLDHFNAQTRGGQGVRGIKLTQRRGAVVAALDGSLDDEILVVSSAGVIIRTAVREIAAQGRDAHRRPGHEPRRRPDRRSGGEGPAGDRGRRHAAEVADLNRDRSLSPGVGRLPIPSALRAASSSQSCRARKSPTAAM